VFLLLCHFFGAEKNKKSLVFDSAGNLQGALGLVLFFCFCWRSIVERSALLCFDLLDFGKVAGFWGPNWHDLVIAFGRSFWLAEWAELIWRARCIAMGTCWSDGCQIFGDCCWGKRGWGQVS